MTWKILRPAALAFLAGVLAYGLGCLTLPESSAGEDAQDDGGILSGGDRIPDNLPSRSAYFVLQGPDLRSPDWPLAWAEMDLIVCNPSLPAEDVATIRNALPGVRLVAYTNVQDIQLGFFPGNPYYDALEAAFDSTWCLRRTDTGEIIRLQGWDGTPGSGVPAWVVHTVSIEAMVAFHRDVTMAAGWDGLYVDQCTATYPAWRQAAILEQTASFDYDGDSLADTMEDLTTEYETSREAYTSRLRQELGTDAILLANAGGALADGALNGITLEGVGDRFTEGEARGILLTARNLARSPWLGAVWVTSQESVAASRAVSETVEGVHYGIVDYFTPSP
jgi:hypothetical protein